MQKSSKSKSQKENQDAPWAEQSKSVVTENRLRLFFTVGLLRILENVFVCGVLPWSYYICRATGHCPERLQLWQLTKILFPAGITTALRNDGDIRNDFAISADRWAALFTAFSIVVVSVILLLAQAISLNSHFLATMGYVTGEWTLVDIRKGGTGSANASQWDASQWDPHRRYKKGDLIVVNRSFIYGGGQAIYKATSNSPEGRPFDMFLRATHDLFRNELGHSSTSKLLSTAIGWHLTFIAILAMMVLGNTILSNGRSNGLLATLFANLLACYGALSVGMTHHGALEQLSEQIAITQ